MKQGSVWTQIRFAWLKRVDPIQGFPGWELCLVPQPSFFLFQSVQHKSDFHSRL